MAVKQNIELKQILLAGKTKPCTAILKLAIFTHHISGVFSFAHIKKPSHKLINKTIFLQVALLTKTQNGMQR
jgi:hypothetical protein